LSGAPIAGYKPYLLNAFARSLLINLSVLFINSMFIAHVGSKGFSQLFFLGSLGTASFYVLLMSLRERAIYSLYQVILGMLAAVMLASWWQPERHWLLYAFNVTVLVCDMLGANVNGLLLQASQNPVVFRNVYHRVISLELIGRLAASAIVWAISQFDHLQWYFPLAAVTLVAHALVYRALPRPERTRDLLERSAASVSGRVKAAFGFAGRNGLARVIIGLTVWTYVTKFLVEFLFYQTVNAHFPSASEVGAFVSAVTFGIILLTLAFQNTIGRRLTSSLPLATLFALQPFTLLVLGSLAMVVDPFYPLVALMVVYQCVNRSIQLPVSRQLLVPMPGTIRSSINFLVPLVTDVSVVIVTGALTGNREFWTIHPTAMLLLVLGGVLFLVLAQLDSFYVRNMWGLYREAREGRWRDALDESHSALGLADLFDETDLQLPHAASSDHQRAASEDLGGRRIAARTRPLAVATQPLYRTIAEVIDEATVVDAPQEARRQFLTLLARDDLPVAMRVSLILDSYARFDDPEMLMATVRSHRQLLRAGTDDEVIAGLQVLFQAGVPTFMPLIVAFTTHRSPAIVQAAKACLKAQDLLEQLPLDRFAAVTRRRFRTVLIEQMVEPTWSSDLEALQALACERQRERASAMIDAIYATRETEWRQVLFACARRVPGRITLLPAVETMAAGNFVEGESWRHVLLAIGRNDDDDDVQAWLLRDLHVLVSAKASLSEPWPRGLPGSTDRLLHALFVTEWTMVAPAAADLVMDTIGDLAIEGTGRLGVLTDIHLEFLKHSDLRLAWIYLLGRGRSVAIYERVLAELTRAEAQLAEP
jgi:hypothetical protein